MLREDDPDPFSQDINDENVLISHFCDARTEWRCDVRQDLRSRRLLSYALFDFDFSILFPRDIDRRFCRLPYERSWGTFCLVYDTAQGEFDFNPFVFEVGNLGVTFCDLFQVNILLLFSIIAYESFNSA